MRWKTMLAAFSLGIIVSCGNNPAIQGGSSEGNGTSSGGTGSGGISSTGSGSSRLSALGMSEYLYDVGYVVPTADANLKLKLKLKSPRRGPVWDNNWNTNNVDPSNTPFHTVFGPGHAASLYDAVYNLDRAISNINRLVDISNRVYDSSIASIVKINSNIVIPELWNLTLSNCYELTYLETIAFNGTVKYLYSMDADSQTVVMFTPSNHLWGVTASDLNYGKKTFAGGVTNIDIRLSKYSLRDDDSNTYYYPSAGSFKSRLQTTSTGLFKYALSQSATGYIYNYLAGGNQNDRFLIRIQSISNSPGLNSERNYFFVIASNLTWLAQDGVIDGSSNLTMTNSPFKLTNDAIWLPAEHDVHNLREAAHGSNFIAPTELPTNTFGFWR